MAGAPDLFENALLNRLAQDLGPGASLTLTANRRTLISIRRRGAAADIRLSRAFALADEDTIGDLISYLKGKERQVPKSVSRFMNGLPQPPRAGRSTRLKLVSRGMAYDLAAIASGLNSRYFAGELGEVRITWGRLPGAPRKARGKTIKLGSYDWELDLITVNPLLDSDDTPRSMVEFVVYHEMLHKKLGVMVTPGGRRMSHTPLFRKMEKEYERYEEAADWEKRNIGRLIRARRRH